MTTQTSANAIPENKSNDKELNFRMLEARYEKELAKEREARTRAEKEILETKQRMQQVDDEEETPEPYVDHKKLSKTLKQFGQQTKQETQSDIQKAVQQALADERKQNWIKNNPDFVEVLQHAEKLYQTNQDLAETILEMPEGFERQKLVYKNIKALGLHKEQAKAPSIQEKIDANRKSPYYQPSELSSSPYESQGNYSPQGQEQAYKKMQELKSRLRI
jgi:hypothetical protein